MQVFNAIVVGLAITAAATAVAKEKTPEVLKRIGSWELNYDKDACHLAAQFGDPKDSLILRMTRYQPSEYFTLGLYGSRLKSTEVDSKVKLDFGLSNTPVEADGLNGSVGKLGAVWVSGIRLDGVRSEKEDDSGHITPEQEAAVTSLTVTRDYQRPLRLDFGSLAKPMAQFRACQTDLVRSWGYDPDQQAHLSREATGKQAPAQWLKPADYPRDAVRMGRNGMVQFRLDVDEVGKIVGCHVLDRTDPDEFADLSCKLVAQRAKLEPALDAAGHPVRSFMIQRVIWRVRS